MQLLKPDFDQIPPFQLAVDVILVMVLGGVLGRMPGEDLGRLTRLGLVYGSRWYILVGRALADDLRAFGFGFVDITSPPETSMRLCLVSVASVAGSGIPRHSRNRSSSLEKRAPHWGLSVGNHRYCRAIAAPTPPRISAGL